MRLYKEVEDEESRVNSVLSSRASVPEGAVKDVTEDGNDLLFY